MIIVRFMGGLGNQLFQYALGRRLSVERSSTVKFDPKFFAVVKDRPYGLANFSTKVEFATDQEADEVKGKTYTGIQRRIFYKWQEQIPYFKRHYVREEVFGFDPNILKVGKVAYLEGYWQSEKYFAAIADQLREELKPAISLSPASAGWSENIQRVPESVSVHIRRGDYVQPSDANQVTSVLQREYYLKAMQFFNQTLLAPVYFVFSDDIEWAMENLPHSQNMHFVAQGPEIPDVEDLILMSCCRHHIIANSSFSWWGAWLSKDPTKLVIAPKIWFPGSAINTEDIYCKNWIRL